MTLSSDFDFDPISPEEAAETLREREAYEKAISIVAFKVGSKLCDRQQLDGSTYGTLPTKLMVDEDGYLHCDDGPALVSTDRSVHYFKHGLYHREDGAAMILAAYPDKTLTTYQYFYNDDHLGHNEAGWLALYRITKDAGLLRHLDMECDSGGFCESKKIHRIKKLLPMLTPEDMSDPKVSAYFLINALS